MFLQIKTFFFLLSYESPEPPSKFTQFNFFHDCTVLITYVTLTDNAEAKRRALRNLQRDAAVSTLASCL